MAEIISEGGKVQLADDVVAVVAGVSALEVDGVFGAGSTISNGLAEAFGVKSAAKGVKLEIDGTDAAIDLNLIVKSGYKILQVSEEAQRKVKSSVETMTGLNVTAVNINIVGVAPPKTKRPGEPRKPRKNAPPQRQKTVTSARLVCTRPK